MRSRLPGWLKVAGLVLALIFIACSVYGIVILSEEEALEIATQDERVSSRIRQYGDAISGTAEFDPETALWNVCFYVEGSGEPLIEVLIDDSTAEVLDVEVFRSQLDGTADPEVGENAPGEEAGGKVAEDSGDSTADGVSGEEPAAKNGTTDDKPDVLEALFARDRWRAFLRATFTPSVVGNAYQFLWFWLGVILFLLLMFDFTQLISLKNADILVLLLLAPFIRYVGVDREFTFTPIILITLYLFIRAVLEIARRKRPVFEANLSRSALSAVLFFVLMLNVVLIARGSVVIQNVRCVKGADYIVDNGGTYNYGKTEEGATYGPLMYFAHIPAAQFRPGGKDELNESDARGISGYTMREVNASKITVGIFHLLTVLGVFLIGRKYGGDVLGLSLASAYGIVPLTLSGMFLASHVIPTCFVIWAFFLLDIPVLSGALLACGAAVLFFPAALFPLWLGYYRKKSRGLILFGTAFGVIALAWAASVLLLTDDTDRQSSLGVFAKSTIYKQEGYGEGQHGNSDKSIWGQAGKGVKEVNGPASDGGEASSDKPLVAGKRLNALAYAHRVVMGVWVLFCLVLFFIPKKLDIYRLASLTAAVLIGTQLWKSNCGGLFVIWYLPFLLFAFIAPGLKTPGKKIEELDTQEIIKKLPPIPTGVKRSSKILRVRKAPAENFITQDETPKEDTDPNLKTDGHRP